MSHTYAHAGRSNPIVAGLRAAFATWRESIQRRRLFERTYNELSSLSDHELADIGISRSEVVDIAWTAAQRV